MTLKLLTVHDPRERVEEAIPKIEISEPELNGATIRLAGVEGLPDDNYYLGAEAMPKNRPQDYFKGKKKNGKKKPPPKKKGGRQKK